MNAVDPAFFQETIRAGYQQRKERHFDKDEQPLEMVEFFYDLIKSSNQIVHNRGKALSYLSNRRDDRPPTIRKAPHQYELKAVPGARARQQPQVSRRASGSASHMSMARDDN